MITTSRRRFAAIITGVAVSSLLLAGCSSASDDADSSAASDTILIGTTDKATLLDPAGIFDAGSSNIINQVYGFLMNQVPGSADVSPDLAESGEYIADSEYQVVLKDGLTFANGNPITAETVKYSFDRMQGIADPNGPSTLLSNLESTEVIDDLTVVFHLSTTNDQTFPAILGTVASAIVDPSVFPADALADDDAILEANAFDGPYVITSYALNSLVQFTKNPEYDGILGEAKTETINLKYYSDQSNLQLDIAEGNIDVAYRSLSATDLATDEANDDLDVTYGPGGEIRYIVFNQNTMPYGAETDDADADKALAVRQAFADLVDREEISDQVYKGTYTPLYSNVPDGLPGATEPFKELYGDGEGGPDADRAAERLTDAGVETPVVINLQYNSDHYGAASTDEYALIKDQLEESGLFTVNLQSTEWVSYVKQYATGDYPVFQLGAFPDYPDTDNYLAPFYGEGNFLQNGYSNSEINDLLVQEQQEIDPDARAEILGQIQTIAATDISNLNLLQGQAVAVSLKDVGGVQDTLDASFKFRFGVLTKG